MCTRVRDHCPPKLKRDPIFFILRAHTPRSLISERSTAKCPDRVLFLERRQQKREINRSLELSIQCFLKQGQRQKLTGLIMKNTI
ncbi:hypothetical protein RUM44_013820 [Polyplax serrata]|uniref:Uncharacterized protein n=1 Tax=Polyplax serrata TaxID=468196 RepID=A0ABR1BFI8_POLSC